MKRCAAMLAYCAEEGCRAIHLMRYFGADDTSPCGTCDRCMARDRAHKAHQPAAERLAALPPDLRWELDQEGER